MSNQSVESAESQTPEVNHYSHEEFLGNLNDIIIDWLKSKKGASIVAEIDPQEIPNWDIHEFQPGRKVHLGIDIQRAVLLRDRQNDYALVLGSRRKSKYVQMARPSLQFGFMPKDPHRESRLGSSPVEHASLLVNQRFSNGSGEFFVHDRLGKMYTDCWADARTFGGDRVSTWPDDKLLTDNGIQACIGIVDRLVERAFIL